LCAGSASEKWREILDSTNTSKMKRDLINDVLVAIKNAESVGKSEVVLGPTSKLMDGILKIMQQLGYIKEFENLEDKKGGKFKIILSHKLNKCGVIKPRFAIKRGEYKKWEQRYLPAADFGILVVSTPQGLMTHYDSKKKGLGGRLIAYVY
jgi:small subunit ribosomal protein S8